LGDFFNILVAGVGGQGTVLLSKLLREYGFASPMVENVVGTETRGVSQRGGSVTGTARYLIDKRIYSMDQGYEAEDLISPLIPMNDAHLVLGLESLETIRNLKLISEQTVVVLNTNKRYPRNVIIGSEQEQKTYPSNARIIDLLDQFARKTISMNFNELSKSKFNDSIYANTILLGVGAKEFKEIFLKETLIKIIKKSLKDPDINLKAFELGYGLI
jgi:indolepyruvate ferredoxin oxidoreductase beta subunit